MAVIRAFIAIDFSEQIREQLDRVLRQLKGDLSAVPIRWVPVQNIHLTLMFLGDVSVANLGLLQDAMRSELEAFPPFEVSIGNIGAFPSINNPRVIWVGVEAPAELIAIQSNIKQRMQRLGYPPEDHPFSPHLTLGRTARGITVAGKRTIHQVLQSTRIGFLGVDTVNEIGLYKSDLQPSGAVYTRIYFVKLAG